MSGLYSPKLRHDARDTSRAAAAAVLPKVGTQRRNVYDAIARYCDKSNPIGDTWGLTDEQISDVTGLSGNSVRPRRLELLEAGLIEENGTRPGLRSAKSRHTVWVVK